MSLDWWTLGFQAVNVLVLVWLLGHFFWKPVAAMIAQRGAVAQQTLADADAQRAQAAAALAEIERTRAGFAQEREAILVEAHATADRARAAALEAASKEAATVAADALAAIDKQKAAADDAWRARATRLAIDIATRLCAPLGGAAVQAVFIDRLVAQIRSLPEAERRTMATRDADADANANANANIALEVISASPLEPDDQRRLQERLTDAFGTAPQLAFRTDAALIAGIELRGAHLIVSNSWRADLQRIETEVVA
ncbi:ATP synthase F0 subunit B [soil metagenome]